MAEVRERAKRAYENLEFLNSVDARTLRILAEYMEPLQRFHKEKVKDTIVFFGSARLKPEDEAAADVKHLHSLLKREKLTNRVFVEKELERAKKHLRNARYYTEAMELARLLTEWSLSLHEKGQHFLICSGGSGGIMEAANRGAMLAGGRSIGLNISLPSEQMPNPYITQALNFEFHYFFMRKFWFMNLAKALVIFPGGFGTLDEFMELITLVQTGKITYHLPIIMYGGDYWKRVVNFKTMADEGMIAPEDLHLIHFSDSPREAFEYLKTNLLKTVTQPRHTKK
jgi:uncharacterized protein (TIGR00730 family)